MTQDREVDALVRRDLLAVEGYSAPASLEELRARFGSRLAKLDQNENPYGCSPRVQEALGKYDGYHAYPDVLARGVRDLLATYTGVASERIVTGNGSDEIIELILRLFVEPGDRVVNCPPTFGYYRFAGSVAGGTMIDVPRRADFDLDIDGIRAAVDDRCKVIFVASPNNPTGNQSPDRHIRELLDLGLVVVVDEAYAEFAECDAIALSQESNRLIIVRTFSKWAGLAGLRAGYGIFPAALARHVNRIKPPFNVSVAAQVAMKASLLDLTYLREIVARIVAERERMLGELRKIEYLRPFPSQANFIFCNVLNASARRIKEQLEEEGILVRIYDDLMLRNAVRFSIGTPEQNSLLLERLRDLAAVPV